MCHPGVARVALRIHTSACATSAIRHSRRDAAPGNCQPGAPQDQRAASPQTPMGPYPSLGGERVRDLLTVLMEAERCAIRAYTDICNYTAGKDHRTYELSQARAEQVQPIRSFPAREEGGWVWVQVDQP